MDREELLERLRGVEWDDFEVKAAQVGVPEDSYKTVSAFSNSSGGWIVFGIAERKGSFEIVGVPDPDNMQGSFLGSCRSSEKFSRPIEARAKLYDFDGRSVLAFYISPAPRFDKPVRVKVEKRWETFIRSAGGDHRCTTVEEARFLRDASRETFDSVVFEGATPDDLDSASLDWFRAHLARRNPELAHQELDPAGFLAEIGLIRGKGDVTNAAALMFGKERLLGRLKPGGVVDLRVIHSDLTVEAPEQRWDDRELCESNLVVTLRSLFERLRRLVPAPFDVDPKTGERQADSPDYIAIREALVNLLVHQDYSDLHRTARILWFRDATVIENPGDSFAEIQAMLDGGSSQVRNPILVRLFRQAGYAEQAGTGIPRIVRTWRGAHRAPPAILNDPGAKLYRLTLDWKPLKSQRDEAWYRRLGVEITEDAGRLLTYGREQGAFDVTRARLVTGLPGRATLTLVSHLVTQQLLAADEIEGEPVYSLAPHLADLWASTPAPPVHPDRGSEGVTGRVTGGVDEGVTGGAAPGRADRVARLEAVIRARPGLRAPQLAEATGLPETTVVRFLSRLRREGGIVFRGAPRTGGYFPKAPAAKGPRGRRNG